MGRWLSQVDSLLADPSGQMRLGEDACFVCRNRVVLLLRMDGPKLTFSHQYTCGVD